MVTEVKWHVILFPVSLSNPIIYTRHSNQKGNFKMSFSAPQVENVGLIIQSF